MKYNLEWPDDILIHFIAFITSKGVRQYRAYAQERDSYTLRGTYGYHDDPQSAIDEAVLNLRKSNAKQAEYASRTNPLSIAGITLDLSVLNKETKE